MGDLRWGFRKDGVCLDYDGFRFLNLVLRFRKTGASFFCYRTSKRVLPYESSHSKTVRKSIREAVSADLGELVSL